MAQVTVKDLINDKTIQQIMKYMNEISNAIEDLKMQKEMINRNIISESFEDLCTDNNNLRMFSSIIDIYSQRLSYLEDLMTEYWSLKLNKEKIDLKTYDKAMLDVKERINMALSPIEFNLSQTPKTK